MNRSLCAVVSIAIAAIIAETSWSLAADPAIVWRTNYDAARKEAQEKGLPMLVEVGTEECVYCRKMDATTLQDPTVRALIQGRFIPLRIDGNRDQALAQALRIQVYPTTVLAGPDGKIHAFLQGYVSADQMKEHANRVVLAVTTPDWVARDLETANKAIAASDTTRAVSLLKGIVAEAKESPARTKAQKVLSELEQTAADQLARAVALSDRGETTASGNELAELIRRYGGTPAASDAATRLAGRVDNVRADRSKELLASAREAFRATRYADCLDQCQQLTAQFPERPEAKDAGTLKLQIENDPERMIAACEQVNQRAATMYLALADTWTKKGNAQEATACLEKVVRLAPNTRYAEVAQLQLKKITTGSDTMQTGFDRAK